MKRYTLRKRYIGMENGVVVERNWFDVLDYATEKLLRDHIEIIVKEINSYSDSEVKAVGTVLRVFFDGELVEEYSIVDNEDGERKVVMNYLRIKT